MREILFRGKRIDNGEWVEGFYNHIPCGRFLCDEHCIQTIKQDGRIGQLYDVYDSTVEQFTGLTDKNGKKIFEGDIIRELDGGMDGIPREACWDEDYMKFKCPLVRKHWAYGYNACDLWQMQSKNIEVIGNIHDNPELLGRAEDGKTENR